MDNIGPLPSSIKPIGSQEFPIRPLVNWFQLIKYENNLKQFKTKYTILSLKIRDIYYVTVFGVWEVGAWENLRMWCKSETQKCPEKWKTAINYLWSSVSTTQRQNYNTLYLESSEANVIKTMKLLLTKIFAQTHFRILTIFHSFPVTLSCLFHL